MPFSPPPSLPFRNQLAALGLALVVALGLPAFVRPAAAQQASAKIGVIDIVKAFNTLEEKSDGDQEIQGIVKKLGDQRKAKEDELKSLETDLKGYRENSKEFNDANEKYLQKTMEYRAFLQYSEQKITIEQRLRTAEIYRRMNRAIEDIAKANGYTVVLMQDQLDLSARTEQELMQHIFLRKVLYSDPGVDITQALIDKMNADYKQHAH